MMQNFLTKKETSSVLRIASKTLERKCAAGEISFVKIGRRVLFSSLEVNDYINRHTIKKQQTGAPICNK